jgi:hypothetical protein
MTGKPNPKMAIIENAIYFLILLDWPTPLSSTTLRIRPIIMIYKAI